jgi:hypothetical protein
VCFGCKHGTLWSTTFQMYVGKGTHYCVTDGSSVWSVSDWSLLELCGLLQCLRHKPEVLSDEMINRVQQAPKT